MITIILQMLKKKKIHKKYNPTNLLLKEHDNRKWYEELAESDDNKEIDDDITPMSPMKGGKKEFVQIQAIAPPEVKEGKGLKILTSNKLLTQLPILLAQIKAPNNSHKLKIEIRQIYILYQNNKITKKLYKNLIKPL